MIIGNGLIARALKSSSLNDNKLVLFASGVSNSLCEDEAEFKRESLLLTEIISQNSDAYKFVYFSTCSVHDESQKLSPYVIHKLRMEKEIIKLPGGLVVRLPQVVGHSNNPHTLTNYFFNCIKNDKFLKIYKNAQRNLIDIDDIVKLLKCIIDSKWVGHTLNIANPNNSYPLDIVREFESILQKRAQYDLIDKGSWLKLDTSLVETFAPICGVNFGEGYLEQLLSKYYAHGLKINSKENPQ